MSNFYDGNDVSRLYNDILTIEKNVWKNNLGKPEIETWLDQFNGDFIDEELEKKYMLYALSKFMYFDQKLVREMLKSLYRDNIQPLILQEVKNSHDKILSEAEIRSYFNTELSQTKIIGIGNPSESGTHLLYLFRQINKLSTKLFSDIYECFEPYIDSNQNEDDDKKAKISWRKNTKSAVGDEILNIKRYIFFDDLVGGGTQVEKYLGNLLQCIRLSHTDVDIFFFSLFATQEGINHLNKPELFNGKAKCLFELDETFKACSNDSRITSNKPDWFDIAMFKNLIKHYGQKISSTPFGHGDCQLFIGFFHNTPNNTLPVFWVNKDWYPIFPRFGKSTR